MEIILQIWHKKDDKILASLILGVFVVNMGDTLQIDKIGMIILSLKSEIHVASTR